MEQYTYTCNKCATEVVFDTEGVAPNTIETITLCEAGTETSPTCIYQLAVQP